MKLLIILFFSGFINCASAQTNAIGVFDNHQDVGNPKHAGSAQYDKVTHTYTISGFGYDMWFNHDEFQFLYKRIKGDFTATANFEFIGTEGNKYRKTGWMIRESTDDNAAGLNSVEHGDGLTVMQWRSVKNESMKEPESEIIYPDSTFEVIQLQRKGKIFTMRVGHIGEPLKLVGSHEMPNMPDEALLGLFICSHTPDVIKKARVWDVHIDTPNAK